MEFIEKYTFLKLDGQLELGACARSKYEKVIIPTIGTCNTLKTEAIDGGVVENKPSVYSWVSQWQRRDVDASTSAALLVVELDVHLTAWETVKDDSWVLTAHALGY